MDTSDPKTPQPAPHYSGKHRPQRAAGTIFAALAVGTLLTTGIAATGTIYTDDPGVTTADVRSDVRSDRNSARQEAGKPDGDTQAMAPPQANDPEAEPPDWVRPSEAEISDHFGPRAWRGGEMHEGMDFAADEGEPNFAAGHGVVTETVNDGGYGKVVRIDHGDGIVTVYGHHSKFSVSEGEEVSAGDEIGLSGSTGDSQGPHLHFEVHVDDQPIDPEEFLEDEGVSL